MNDKILTLDNSYTDPLQKMVEVKFRGINCKYLRSYYLDYEVDENNGKINWNKKVMCCTSSQMEVNLKRLREAYDKEKAMTN